MAKINEELLNFFVTKYLGYMTADAQKNVEVTDLGFVYKGELIVSVPGLRDKLIIKEPVTVGELKKEEPKKEERKVFTVEVGNLPEEKILEVLAATKEKFAEKIADPVETPAPVAEVKTPEPAPTHTYPGKKRGPKPKNKTQ